MNLVGEEDTCIQTIAAPLLKILYLHYALLKNLNIADSFSYQILECVLSMLLVSYPFYSQNDKFRAVS
jgi:hypothetical protein